MLNNHEKNRGNSRERNSHCQNRVPNKETAIDAYWVQGTQSSEFYPAHGTSHLSEMYVKVDDS